MKELGESIAVPFIGDDCIDYGEGEASQIQALIRKEFGNLDGLIITSNKVSLNGQVLIDLDADEIFNRASVLDASYQKSDPRIVRDFDTPLRPKTKEDDLIFTTRLVERNTRLRIAIHSDLMQVHRAPLRLLIDKLKTYSVESYEVDLSRCNSISVTGIGILLLIKENAALSTEQFTLKNCTFDIFQKLQWAQMSQYFTIHAKHR